jgi:hypothetical protein
VNAAGDIGRGPNPLADLVQFLNSGLGDARSGEAAVKATLFDQMHRVLAPGCERVTISGSDERQAHKYYDRRFRSFGDDSDPCIG